MTATKEQIWTEEFLKPSTLNETILQPLSNMDSTDNTVVSETGSSYATKRTLGIDADQISNYIIIRGNLRAKVDQTAASAGDATAVPNAQITIDSVQKLEVTGPTATHRITTAASVEWISDGLTSFFCFKYTPSSAEKAAGFTIDLDLKITSGGTNPTGETAYNDTWEVWGA